MWVSGVGRTVGRGGGGKKGQDQGKEGVGGGEQGGVVVCVCG
jgi:hypothetical protein